MTTLSAPPRTRLSGAATPWVASAIAGRQRAGEVVHAGRDAVYVDVAGACIGVLTTRAVHVPCGVATSLPALDAGNHLGVGCGAPALVGAGRLVVGGWEIGVGRLRDAALPTLDGARLGRFVVGASGLLHGRLRAVRGQLPLEGLAALAEGDPAAVPTLLGLGTGLTPLGDDVLAGWLATTAAAAEPRRLRLAAAVAALASERTTSLSATLLECAARAETVPPFRDLVEALACWDAGASSAALSSLLSVGHTSGAGLALGLALALPLLSHRAAPASGDGR